MMAQMADMEGNPAAHQIDAAINDFDIEMSNLDEDYCILASPERQLKNRSFHGNRPRLDSQASLHNHHLSSTRKSSLSMNNAELQQEDLRFKRYE